MNAKIIFFIFCCVLGYVTSASTYDQRQTGGLNVQVDLKDLQFVALMKGGKEEYVDYDYAYDYSEMTIKPQNGTTPKPLNGTTVADTPSDTIPDNSTVVTVVTEQTSFVIKNNTQSLETPDESTFSTNDTSTTVKSFETSTTAAMETSHSWNSDLTSSSTPQVSTLSGCKKGFFMNEKGDCELKLQGAGNALLKLVKLSQKLKLRRENKRNEDLPPSSA